MSYQYFCVLQTLSSGCLFRQNVLVTVCQAECVCVSGGDMFNTTSISQSSFVSFPPFLHCSHTYIYTQHAPLPLKRATKEQCRQQCNYASISLFSQTLEKFKRHFAAAAAAAVDLRDQNARKRISENAVKLLKVKCREIDRQVDIAASWLQLIVLRQAPKFRRSIFSF